MRVSMCLCVCVCLCACVCVCVFPSQQDTCLAEVSLSLSVQGDVSLPELQPGHLELSVRTLLAELHEGLFLSQLLVPPPSPAHASHDATGEGAGTASSNPACIWPHLHLTQHSLLTY